MKGIEGLALQYIVVIVVAALVIGAIFTIVTTFTNTASSSSKTLNQTLSAGFNQQTEKTCVSFSGCQWLNNSCVCT